MHKSVRVFTFEVMMTSLVMLTVMPMLNNNNNSAFAQGYYNNNNYDNNNSYYSQYPTDNKKYECRTGPFEGFFVSSVEFCKHVKFDDRKDHSSRDNRTGTQGPQGQPGVNGTTGATGATGPQGLPGITQLINGSNIYTVVDLDRGNTTIVDPLFLSGNPECDQEDFPLTGGYSIGGVFSPTTNFATTDSEPRLGQDPGWFSSVRISGFAENVELRVTAFCFDNPPPH